MESPAFFILLFIHLSSLILAFGSVLVTDLYGLLWMRNRAGFEHIINVTDDTEKFIWTGYILMVAAGIPLIILKGEVDNLMLIKLASVAVIGINGIPLHLLQEKMQEFKKDDVIPGIFIFRLSLSITISQVGWWVAIIIGFLHRHVSTIINWPARPWLFIALVLTGFLLIWGIGEMIFKGKTGTDYVET